MLRGISLVCAHIVTTVMIRMMLESRSLADHFPGLIIPTHLVIVIEFNVTIIAASLVVMRPCFQAIYEFFFRKSGHSGHDFKHSSIFRSTRQRSHSGYIISPSEVARRAETDGTGITKTVDIEMASRTVSTEEILQGIPDGRFKLDNVLTAAIENLAQRTETDRPEWHEDYDR